MVAGEPGQPERLRDFNEHVRHLMVRDIDAEPYTEHHTAARLEFRFTPKKGVPFPVFAAASGEFPDLRVEVDWENGPRALRGRAVLERGKLIEQRTEPLVPVEHAAQIDVGVSPEGELLLAVVCRRDIHGAWTGYAAAADRHVYFRFAQGELALEDAAMAEPDEALEALALDFAAEWLWFDESDGEESAIERARYAGRGWKVRGANVKSERLARLPVSTLGPEAQTLKNALRDALRNELQTRRPGRREET